MNRPPLNKEARAVRRVMGRLMIRADRRLTRIRCRLARWFYRTEGRLS